MLEMGFIVALGLIVMIARLSWRRKLWLTSHPLFCDVFTFVLLCFLHWGTFSGVMVATVGALFCSLTLSAARKTIGYLDARGNYQRGFWDVSQKLT